MAKKSDGAPTRFTRYNRSLSGRYRNLKNAAQKRNIEVNLSLDDYVDLVATADCDYCDGPLDEAGYCLDRKDSSKGYTADNVVPCCGSCNSIKRELLTHEEARVAIAAITALRKARQCK